MNSEPSTNVNPDLAREWNLAVIVGTAGELHGREFPTDGGRYAWFMRPTAKALVLGSTQNEKQLNMDAIEADGVELVKRRSGGGAVLVLPEAVTWLDLVIPVGDPWWVDDVGQAMYPVGELWRQALETLGVYTTVHRGALMSTGWSREVCFAGIGSGEVLDADGRKLVGISQRRTRYGARFQTIMYHHDTSNDLLRYFNASADEANSLIQVLTGTTSYRALDQKRLADALKHVLRRSGDGNR